MRELNRNNSLRPIILVDLVLVRAADLDLNSATLGR